MKKFVLPVFAGILLTVTLCCAKNVNAQRNMDGFSGPMAAGALTVPAENMPQAGILQDPSSYLAENTDTGSATMPILASEGGTASCDSEIFLEDYTGGFEYQFINSFYDIYHKRDFVSYDLKKAAAAEITPALLENQEELQPDFDSMETESFLEDISFTFYKTPSRYSSFENIDLYVSGDEITLLIPHEISSTNLKNAFVQFKSETCECTLEAPEAELLFTVSGNIIDVSMNSARTGYRGQDLTQNAILKVTGEKETRTYRIRIQRKTYDLPILFLTTDDGEDVTSRYEYVSGNVLIDNGCLRTVSNGSNYAKNHQGTYYENTYKREQDKKESAALDGALLDVGIRGRGNASWWKFPQKSYMLKFDQKISLFGMTSAKKYALVSTYGDPSLIRNCIAMDIATSLDHLEYTAGQLPVDVFLNGTYLGVYTLSEKVDEASDKIDLFSGASYSQIKNDEEITDIPFVVECGNYVKDSYLYGQDYFMTPHSPQLFIKYPEITEPYSEEFNYIHNYMTKADQAMTLGYGYDKYIDIDSWVDWFIVMEITNNTDSALCRSTYLYKRADGKLMIGPVWDFDTAFGNYYYDNPTYEYWASAEPIFISAQDHYMSYLYKSDSFMLAVQKRWDEKKEELYQVAMDAVDKYADQVAASRASNNSVRKSGGTSYQVDAVRQFIKRRFNWIDHSIHSYDFNRHEPTESVPIFEPEEIPLIEPDENADFDELGEETEENPDLNDGNEN